MVSHASKALLACGTWLPASGAVSVVAGLTPATDFTEWFCKAFSVQTVDAFVAGLPQTVTSTGRACAFRANLAQQRYAATSNGTRCPAANSGRVDELSGRVQDAFLGQRACNS